SLEEPESFSVPVYVTPLLGTGIHTITVITDARPAQRRAAYGLAIVLTAQLMLLLDATVVKVALPLLKVDLGLGPLPVGSPPGGLAQDPAMLIASRALQGVGTAIAAPSVLALITSGATD